MTDPREQPLNDVSRKIMAESNYDPHFSGIEERVIMETKLFLARWDALQAYQVRQIEEECEARIGSHERSNPPVRG